LLAIAGEALDADELTAPAESPALLSAWLAACHDWRPILGHGERGQLAVLASTRDQIRWSKGSNFTSFRS